MGTWGEGKGPGTQIIIFRGKRFYFRKDEPYPESPFELLGIEKTGKKARASQRGLETEKSGSAPDVCVQS